jgi:chromosome segregation ATPase
MAKNYKFILTALLCGITIFSVFKYVTTLKEKYEISNRLDQMKQQVVVLESEKQNLLQTLKKEEANAQRLGEENIAFQASLKESEEKLNKLDADFKSAQKTIEQLNSELAALKTEKTKLNSQLSEVSQEKDSLNVRLNSVEELKKAIRELRSQMRKVKVQIKEKTRVTKDDSAGNHGFVIKDGKPTSSLKVKIEVKPAPKE